ncbi:prolipoprotein diacylglyceryl transferase [Nesterenkonia flava]|uniref:Phosphatidylglycerol--prolipoprotein diacylglyceryl transferase n=1 Tax=Nesterenkonia flava TaxID=469799 RepID=A0ABU1FVH8_9MICC|nr:prolipoprotein diacylglyceryl transferase [Nesterenkonia flava]MDR5712677.1 prolipoprotein diacylglyceryl transferase [Nesterenkonia flava]
MIVVTGFPPPPAQGIDLPGPLFIAFYTLAILLGIVAAIFVATKLWTSRGGRSEDVFDAAIWAVLLGIVGGRLYHVITSPERYFGENGDLLRIVQVWNGGLGILGAVALGAVGVWIACRRMGAKFPAFADAVVPGVILAQAIGRWGNWFNQELYGRATDLPWGLRINPDLPHQAPPRENINYEIWGFHPTFLYESLWNLLGFVALLLLYRRFQVRQGLLTLTYVAYYGLGRFWIESLRIDERDKATQYPLADLTGLDWRLNQWTALALFIAAVVGMIVLMARSPRTEEAIAEQAEIYTPEARKAAEVEVVAETEEVAEDTSEASPEGVDGDAEAETKHSSA